MIDEERAKLEESFQAPAPEASKAGEDQILSPKRRSALVTYLAILFAVAFLFVALTMALETKRLKTMNQELQDSNQKTSASLTGNINALQAENQLLLQKEEALQQQVQALEEAARNDQTEKESLRAELEQLAGEKAALEAEQEALVREAAAQAQRASDAVTVSELLHAALAANDEGNLEALPGLLGQIEPLKDLLSPTEMEYYESLTID